MKPFSLRAFQRDQECDLKHPCWVDLISSNKTNKLPFFIDRLVYVSYSKYYDLFPRWDMQLYANFLGLLVLINICTYILDRQLKTGLCSGLGRGKTHYRIRK